MIFKIVTLTALTIYLLFQREYIFSIWALLCLIPFIGLYLAIFLAIVLLFSGHEIIGILLGLFILYNLIGNEILKKFRRTEYEDESDVVVNFIRYCREYFLVMKGFNEDHADLAILDPKLGEMMDEIKGQWSSDMVSQGEDPDKYLLDFKFEANEMSKINEALDEYSEMFSSRKEFIINYLKEIGHPKEFELG